MIFILHSIVLIAATGGACLSLYIYLKKRRKQTLVCPIGSDCSSVIHSEYSRFLGFPLELLGFLYYISMAVSYSVFLTVPILKTPLGTFILVCVSGAAFLFSLYLTFIQGAVLKQWCTWCLFSATLTTIILLSSIGSAGSGVLILMGEYKRVFVALHLIGMALGLGGATISDLFFFRFLKDLRISLEEANILHMFSQIIWVGLGIAIISGIGLYLPDMARLNESAKFMVKVIVVAVVTINGLFLNLKIAPLLVKISFGKKHTHQKGELHRERRLAYALGAVSMVSWYSAFTLGMFRSSPLDFLPLLGVYTLLLIVGIGVSQVVEKQMGKKVMDSA